MLRWLLVCALVAHAKAASTQKRHVPSWTRLPKVNLPEMPQIDFPEMPQMPSLNLPDIQLPDFTLPDMPALPDINLPDIFTGRGGTGRGGAQNPRTNQRQSPPGRTRTSTSDKLRKGQPSSTTQRVTSNKQRKQRQNQQRREGPPQRQELVRPHQRNSQRPSSYRTSTRTRQEPSVRQQIEEFRQGMPQWLQTELEDTFSTMNHEIEQGRLRMNSWADDISTAAQNWWDQFNRQGDRTAPSRERPQAIPFRRPSSNQNTRGDFGTNRQGGSWWNNQGRGDQSRTPGRGPSSFGRGHTQPFGQGFSQPFGRGQSQPFGQGQSQPFGRGHSQPFGRGHTGGRHQNWGSGHSGSRRWWQGSNTRNSTWCKRPFRPRGDTPTKEEPAFEVLCGGNDYEARLYNASVWVSVTVKAFTYDLAVHKAYAKLYRYIKGHNANGTEISRTVPVHTKVKTESRDSRWFECHNYTISFYLPEDVHMDPPEPNDPELFIEYEEPTVYYAHAFRGFALEFNIFEYLDELTNTLDLSNEAFNMEEFFVNVYDAPWRFFNRRNDILVAMDTSVLESPQCAAPEPEQNTTTTAPPTEAVTTAAPTTPGEPVIQGEVPAAIILPGNPFDNNDLEQETGPVCVQGSECPRYETAIQYQGFEQRHFAYSRWICMDQAACDFDKARENTKSLGDYFTAEGNREQIAMTQTTPWVIGVDASDLNRKEDTCATMYTSCYFIPEQYQSDPPTPRDARLYIQDIPAMSRYVKPFGGYATSQNVPKLSVEFLTTLSESKLPYDSSLVAIAQYGAQPGKAQHNEVWVMDQSLLQGIIGTE